jgi:hypothetical protein
MTKARLARALTTTLVLAACSGVGAVAADADDGSDITIVNPVHIDDAGEAVVSSGPFTATGAAVADGLLCASGTITELHTHGVGLPDGDFRVLVLKQLACDDRPGTLELVLWVDVVEGVGNSFEWQALWGTQALADICGGGGEGSGVWAQDPAVIDSYAGRLRSGDACPSSP